jgi:alpha-tubulin suppressor-like RCC1 family protein
LIMGHQQLNWQRNWQRNFLLFSVMAGGLFLFQACGDFEVAHNIQALKQSSDSQTDSPLTGSAPAPGVPATTSIPTSVPTPVPTPVPTAVPTVPATLKPRGAKTISGGAEHTCAVTSTRKVRCWGRNSSGQLGNNSTLDSLTPVEVVGLSDAVSVVASESHSCAVTAPGLLYCWGDNTSGQLGINSDQALSLLPVLVPGPSPVQMVSSNGLNMCALTTAGEVYCWGWAALGELGNGTNQNPTKMITAPAQRLTGHIVTLTSSWHNQCALNDQGVEFCWGDNRNGRLGIGTAGEPSLAVAVSGVAGHVKDIGGIGAASCAILDDMSVKCWGTGGSNQLAQGSNTNDSYFPVTVMGMSGNPIMITGGWGHACVLLDTGKVKCWGNNPNGALGNGTTSNASVTVDVIGNAPIFVVIDAGWQHTCGITSDSEVWCWGLNERGQLGTGTTTSVAQPVRVDRF